MTSTERLHPELHDASASAAGAFRSILFPNGDAVPDSVPQPDCFPDLNLDQVVAAIVAGRDEYELTPFFHLPLSDVETVCYRQQVFQDFEAEEVTAAVRAFAEEMRRTRSYLTLAHKQHYKPEKQRWFLDQAASIPQHAFLKHIETPQGTALAMLCLRPVKSHGANFYLIGGRKLDGVLQTLSMPPGLRVSIYSSPEQGSGGEIDNIPLGAAFLASAAHTPIGMDEVVRSVARHRLRQGKLPGAAEFGPFLHLARAEGAGG